MVSDVVFLDKGWDLGLGNLTSGNLGCKEMALALALDEREMGETNVLEKAEAAIGFQA